MYFAFDSTTNLPKVGDAANITAYESLDYGSVTVLTDTSAVEMDATNAKGYYLFDLTQAETNGNTILFTAKSSTANIVVIGAPAVVQTVPAAFTLVGGAAGGVMIAGSNAATTFATLTVTGAVAFQSTFAVTTSTALAALSATTVTFSGAVAFQSTFVVTTSTSLAALSCTTLTASGAVAFQSTFAVTTSTNLAALSCSTFAASGTVTFNAFTVTNALTVSGTTTLTGAVTASNASNNIVGVTLGTTQTFNNTGTWTGNIVGTLSTVTTYTGNTPQTGDSFARIGVAGVGLTNVVLPTGGLANVTAIANLDATVSSRLASASYTAPLTAATTRSALGLATANLDTQLAAIDADVLTRSDYDPATDGVFLASNGLDLVVVEVGLNARQALAIIASSGAGVLAGAATTSITISAAGVSATNRISATVDSSGNRTAVSLSPPA